MDGGQTAGYGNSRGDEIARYHFGSLVDQLVERVLAVSARLTPDDWTRLVIHRVAVTVNVLTVGFHIALLEVGRKAMHVLVVRQDRFGFSAKEVVVPDTNQRQQHRQVFLRCGGGEVFIHRVRAGEQFNEVIEAYGQNDGQTDGRPQRVTAANPVPELKHIIGINSKFRYGFYHWSKALRSVLPPHCYLSLQLIANHVQSSHWS